MTGVPQDPGAQRELAHRIRGELGVSMDLALRIRAFINKLDAEPDSIADAVVSKLRDEKTFEGWPPCIMCGGKRHQHCTVISGSGEPGDHPGDPRSTPHGQRAQPKDAGTEYDPGDRFTAVKDEPNHYRGEPHTAQCGPDCPLRDDKADE